MNEKEVQNIIDYFADWNIKHAGKDLQPPPVKIGDVLKKIEKEPTEFRRSWKRIDQGEAMRLWRPCDFTSSLQEIVEKAGWEGGCPICFGNSKVCTVSKGRLKSPALELLTFLAKLIPKK